MEEITVEWLKIAEEDYKMAGTAFRAKRYPHMLVFCQQTLEKGFKAYYYEKNRKTPPYKHDLIALAKDTGLLSELPKDWTGFLAEVSQCYFTARYPDKYKEITKIFDKKKSRATLKLTGVIYKWLKKKLT